MKVLDPSQLVRLLRLGRRAGGPLVFDLREAIHHAITDRCAVAFCDYLVTKFPKAWERLVEDVTSDGFEEGSLGDMLAGLGIIDGDDNSCGTCQGTGIGQHGDPDTSRCHSCRGRGVAA